MVGLLVFVIIMMISIVVLIFILVLKIDAKSLRYLNRNLTELDYFFSKTKCGNAKERKFWINCTKVSLSKVLEVSERNIRLVKNKKLNYWEDNVLCSYYKPID